MSPVSLEAFLAKLYTDGPARARFLADPANEARSAGLGEADVIALCGTDRAGLCMAAASYARKREQYLAQYRGVARVVNFRVIPQGQHHSVNRLRSSGLCVRLHDRHAGERIRQRSFGHDAVSITLIAVMTASGHACRKRPVMKVP